jgi:ribonuclease P protein component
VQRHRLSRRLRHAARDVIDGCSRSEHIVIRALPSSRDAVSARLGEELLAGLRRIEGSGSKR